MKKKIISLGLLATVLSFTSCVKDNESDSVVAQRQAQTEKLKAEAKEALSNAGLVDAQAKVQEAILKLKEQEVALKELQVAKQKALDAYELALAEKQNEVDLLEKKQALVKAEGKLELAKAQLEIDKETAWRDLEDLKLQIIKDKDEVAQAIENYKGTKDKEALANLESKYSAYSGYMTQLEGQQKDLIDAKQGVITAENNFVDVKVQKELEIKREERAIVSYKKQVEFLKQYAHYSNDIPALNVKSVEAREKAGKARDYAENVVRPKLREATEKLQNENSIWTDKNSEFKFFEAASNNLLSPYVITNGSGRKSEVVTVEKEGQTVDKKVYDTSYLPTIDVDKYNLKIDDYTISIEAKEKDLKDNLEPNKTNKYNDKVAKKEEYEKDKSDATKRKDYEDAIEAYKIAVKAVEDKKAEINEVKAEKSELQDLRSQFTNADNQKAVKDYLENLNKLETAKAEAQLNYEIANAKYNDLLQEYYALENIKRGAVSIENQIDGLNQNIKDSERNIADLSGVQTKEQLVAVAKAEVARIEQRIELLNKKVDAAKKAYEEALAAL